MIITDRLTYTQTCTKGCTYSIKYECLQLWSKLEFTSANTDKDTGLIWGWLEMISERRHCGHEVGVLVAACRLYRCHRCLFASL